MFRKAFTRAASAAKAFSSRSAVTPFASRAAAGLAALSLGAAASVACSAQGATPAAVKAPYWGKPGTPSERTFIALKPDAVQRGLVGDIIKRFEAKGEWSSLIQLPVASVLAGSAVGVRRPAP